MMRIALISTIRSQTDYLVSVQHNLKIVLILFVNDSFRTRLINTSEHKKMIFMHHIHNTILCTIEQFLDKFYDYHTICHKFYYNFDMCNCD